MLPGVAKSQTQVIERPREPREEADGVSLGELAECNQRFVAGSERITRTTHVNQ